MFSESFLYVSQTHKDSLYYVISQFVASCVPKQPGIQSGAINYELSEMDAKCYIAIVGSG